MGERWFSFGPSPSQEVRFIVEDVRRLLNTPYDNELIDLKNGWYIPNNILQIPFKEVCHEQVCTPTKLIRLLLYLTHVIIFGKNNFVLSHKFKKQAKKRKPNPTRDDDCIHLFLFSSSHISVHQHPM